MNPFGRAAAPLADHAPAGMILADNDRRLRWFRSSASAVGKALISVRQRSRVSVSERRAYPLFSGDTSLRYWRGEWLEQHAVAASRQRDSGEKLSD